MNPLLSIRTCLILPCCLFLMPLISPAAEWEETKSQIANFSIQFPGESNYSVQEVDTEAGKLKLHMFIVEADRGNTAYIVFCTEYPDEVFRQKSVEQVLDDAAKGAWSKGNLDSQKKIVVDGCSGRDLVFTKASASGIQYVNWRLMLFNKNLYQIGCVSIGKKVDKETFERMRNSFKFLRK